MLEAMWWGLFAASSLVLGALAVFVHTPSRRVLGLVMGFGAGVLLDAVSFELFEDAVQCRRRHRWRRHRVLRRGPRVLRRRQRHRPHGGPAPR